MEYCITKSCLTLLSAVCGYFLDNGENGIRKRIFHISASILTMTVFFLIYPSAITVLKGYIFTIILYKASISDIRTREVPDYLSIMIIITSLIGTVTKDIPGMAAGALIVPSPMLIAAIMKPGRMGGADIKIMAAGTFFLGFAKGMAAMQSGLLLGVACTLIIRKIDKNTLNDSFPLVAYLSAGCFFMLLL